MRSLVLILISAVLLQLQGLAQQQKTTSSPQKNQQNIKLQTQPNKKQETKKNEDPKIPNCTPVAYIRDIVEALKASGGYKFLRSYTLEGPSNRPIQHEYIFSKGTIYYVKVASYADSRLKVTLYDPEGRLLVSSYDSDIQKFSSSIEFQCTKTGLYKIVFEHHFNKRDFCGGAVLAFRR